MYEKSKRIEGVRALLSPRNVAIVGASDRLGSWSKTVWASLTRTGFAGPIYPINPRSATVWGDKVCYPDFMALPEAPDHVVILVPGGAVVETIREAGRAGARSATIFSSGFGEGGDASGQRLGRDLRAAIIESGLAVSGPNCLGNLAAPSSFMTLTDRRITELRRGPIAIFGQSGGIVTAIYRSLTNRGMQPGYALTVGNEAGLNSADYINYFVEDKDTQVIACFIEAIREPDAFKSACIAARQAGKAIVAMKIGGSEASRSAALAHTGSLAGSLQCFDALAEAVGVIRVETIDEMTEVIEILTHGKRPLGARIGAITFSGGLKGLLLEAGERNGVEFPILQPETIRRLGEVLGIGTSLGNPLDAGFAALSSRDAYLKCVEIMQDDSGIDQIVVQEELPNAKGVNEKAGNLLLVDAMMAKPHAKPVAVVSMASYMYNDYTREFRSGFMQLPVLHEVDKALRALKRVGLWNSSPVEAALTTSAPQILLPHVEAILDRATPAADKRRILNETDSKALLNEYGIQSPREIFAASAGDAVQAADAIGYPVVMKLVSPDVLHKTEVGGVVVDLQDAQSVRAAFDRIRSSLRTIGPELRFEGVLVADQVRKGVELVIGVQRDPEVGLTAMFGSGGIMLELHRDVSFGSIPLNAKRAQAMIERTRVVQLLKGFRGSAPCDHEAITNSLLAVSRLATDLGDRLESIDINPLVSCYGKTGVLALDALIVLREPL